MAASAQDPAPAVPAAPSATPPPSPVPPPVPPSAPPAGPPPASAADIPPHVRRPLLADGVLSRSMDTLTGGAFLAGLGLFVGASSFQLGVLAALPFLAQAANLPALALLLKVKDRRAATIALAACSRLLLLLLAGLLWFAPSLVTPPVLLLALAAGAVATIAATAAWNWWMRDLLPADSLGRFFGRRLRGTTLAGIAVLLAAGWGLDALDARGLERQGYALLFTAGAACGLAGLWFLGRTPHVPPPPSPPAAQSFRLLRASFQDARTRAVLGSLGTASAAVTVSLPFVTVFLLRTLGVSYLAVTVLAVVSQAGYAAGLRGWGHLADRHGDRGVLLVSLLLLSLCLGGWVLAGGSGWPTLAWAAVLHALGGYALGGIDLGSTNLMLRSAPPGSAAAHLAAVGLGKAALAGAATLAAGFLWQALGTQPLAELALPLVGAWRLRPFQVLSLVALLLALAALAATAALREPQRRPVVEVARAMRREVQQLSSVAGMRVFLHAVSYTVEFMAAPFAARLPAGRRRRRREGAGPPPAAAPPAEARPPGEPEPA